MEVVFSDHDPRLHSLQARHWYEGCGTMNGYHHPMGMPEKKKITSLNKWENGGQGIMTILVLKQLMESRAVNKDCSTHL